MIRIIAIIMGLIGVIAIWILGYRIITKLVESAGEEDDRDFMVGWVWVGFLLTVLALTLLTFIL
jgi:uncharacterized BrkB/YihY/UPF0761 family membrane protein